MTKIQNPKQSLKEIFMKFEFRILNLFTPLETSSLLLDDESKF